jgi:hypothetical protein
VARVSLGIGAYGASISSVATAWPASSRSIRFTLPTETPEIRMSDSCASWVASVNGTSTR